MKYTISHIRFLLIALVLLQVGCYQSDEDINPFTEVSDYEAYLQEEMEIQKIPALSVVIFDESQLLYEQYLGWSNIEAKQALEEDHLFLLASISKVVTATALLQLFEEGQFALDDPINAILPFEIKLPEYDEAITFRMLLTHTSGIADGGILDDHYYYGEDSPIGLETFFRQYFKPGGMYYDEDENFHDFAPGTQYAYSNVGSALIGYLVEILTQKDFNTYCKEQIFNPLGMDHTFWRLAEIQQTIVQPYHYQNGDFEEIQHYTFTDYPNGGLRSTSRDLYKLLRALLHQGTLNDEELLEVSTIHQMYRPQIPEIDNTVGLHMFQLNTEYDLWGHDGGEQGVSTIMGFHPDTKVGVIVLCNQGEADLDDMLLESYQLGLHLAK